MAMIRPFEVVSDKMKDHENCTWVNFMKLKWKIRVIS